MSPELIGELLHVGMLIVLLVLGWMLDRHHKASSTERQVIRNEVDYLLERLGVNKPDEQKGKGA